MYYRSMRGVRAAIRAKIKIWSYSDSGINSGRIEILHQLTGDEIKKRLNVILQRIYRYDIETHYLAHGFNSTTIKIHELSEVAGPIPPEFLTN